MHSITHMYRANTLLKIYRIIKTEPERVWLRKDFRRFADYKQSENHLNILTSLNIIEKIKTLVLCGNYERYTKGWRLIKK